MGRAEENDLVVRGNLISRLHARIELSRGKFLLIDQSTNGTFVNAADGEESFVRRDSMQLKGEGMIGLGKVPEAESPQTIRFVCEEDRLKGSGFSAAARRRRAPRTAPSACGRRTRPGSVRMSAASLRHASGRPTAVPRRTRRDVEAGQIQVFRAGQVADGGFLRAAAAGAALEHPREHAQVVAEARPQELAVASLAEPVDVEDLRRAS
jgi:hypothetical protein